MDTKSASEDQEKRTDAVILLERIAQALERMSPAAAPAPDLGAAAAWVWSGQRQQLRPVHAVSRVSLALLQAIEPQKAALLENSRRFAAGRVANNALLWGARGMGKSSLVKAVHGELEATGLKLVEIERDDIDTLPDLLRLVAAQPYRCILFCDDLSFEAGDMRYKALKAVLEGGVEGKPENVVFYATSNRRHIVAREAMENETDSALQARDVIDDKVSLADRFGLWIGFHPCSQDDYLAMVRSYAAHAQINLADDALVAQALEWQITRGSRSGRVAWQFITSLR